jgi:hypothetical protein
MYILCPPLCNEIELQSNPFSKPQGILQVCCKPECRLVAFSNFMSPSSKNYRFEHIWVKGKKTIRLTVSWQLVMEA